MESPSQQPNVPGKKEVKMTMAVTPIDFDIKGSFVETEEIDGKSIIRRHWAVIVIDGVTHEIELPISGCEKSGGLTVPQLFITNFKSQIINVISTELRIKADRAARAEAEKDSDKKGLSPLPAADDDEDNIGK